MVLLSTESFDMEEKCEMSDGRADTGILLMTSPRSKSKEQAEPELWLDKNTLQIDGLKLALLNLSLCSTYPI